MASARAGSSGTSARVVLDPRLFIGIALVVASVAGVVALVSGFDKTEDVYVAGAPLSPGDRITVDDLMVRSVQLESVGDLYLSPDDLPDEGLVVSRPIGQGELVPAASVRTAVHLDKTAVVLTVTSELAAAVTSGAEVDIWSAEQVAGGTYDPPKVIAAEALVVRLVSEDSIVVGGSTTGIELLVPTSSLAKVLAAIANSAAISVVPASLGSDR